MVAADTPSEASWEAWPRYIEQDRNYSEVSQSVIQEYGEENLTTAFRKACNVLMKRSSISTSDIPLFSLADLPKVDAESIKHHGCFVVKNTIDPAEVDLLFEDLQKYINENDEIKGFPDYNPCIKQLFWSKLQILLREHPNHLKLQKWINQLWSTEFSDPITYADRVRVSPPRSKMSALGPHIDAGSLSRWGDTAYRRFYDAALRGSPEELDLYDITTRKEANDALYKGVAHSSIFRTFQGWTALSSIGHHRAGIYLRPYPNETISYVMLRPFFRPTKDPLDADYLNPDTWIFDPNTSFFPGTHAENSQHLSADSHPHLNLKNTLVSIPDLEPGDTVWWHCDMIHAVDVDNDSDDSVGVVYIAASPSTEMNLKYVKNQADAFKTGCTPSDFAVSTAPEHTETVFKGYPGNVDLLSEAGKIALLVK